MTLHVNQWEDLPEVPKRLGPVECAKIDMRAHPGRVMLIGTYASDGSASPQRAKLNREGFIATTRPASDRPRDRRRKLYAYWPKDRT